MYYIFSPQGQCHSTSPFHHFGHSAGAQNQTLRHRHLKYLLAQRCPHGQFCKVTSLHVSHLFEEWWNGRSELWQQFASLQRFSDRVASREGLRRTGWHSSRIEQMMRGDQFQLTDVSPRQSECQSHSVTRCVILLQEGKAILAQCLFLFLCAVFDYCNVEHEL